MNEKTEKKLKSVRSHIQHRCLNPNNDQYNNYGGRGVTLDENWVGRNDIFLREAPLIEGWDEEKFLDGRLQLDKDLKITGNKYYSKETCMWTDRKINMQVQPSRQKDFYALNEDTLELRVRFNAKLFSKEIGSNAGSLNGYLRGRKHRLAGWWVWYSDEEPPVIKRYFIHKDGETYMGHSPQEVSEKANLNRGYASTRLKKSDPWKPSIGNSDISVWSETLNVKEIITEHTGKSPTNIERATYVTGVLANE